MSTTDIRPTMAGTEGTDEYQVVAESSFGTLGYRDLGDSVRIRLEPADEAHASQLAKTLTRDAGWKQPSSEGQNRFSTVVLKGDEAAKVFKAVYALIKRGRPITHFPASREYGKALAG